MKLLAFFLFFSFGLSQAQQLNCTVTINTQKLNNPNQQVFKTLEASLNEFVNKTNWTDQVYNQNEKINCSIYITLSAYNSDQFEGTIQVQSSRLVYNSTYASPILNYNDRDFSFKYTEFENLIFNPSVYESNLVSVVSFYCYVILGMDADSFVPELGTKHFETAQEITNVAQQGGYKGWSQTDGLQSRYTIINNLLSPTYKEVRLSSYGYHAGLDTMNQDLKTAKEKIKSSLISLGKLSASTPNSYLTRVFFDAKSDEIVSIFTGGPSILITDLVDSLNKTSPVNSSKWALIKY